MINYKLGCNFDEELIDRVKDLNDTYREKGSIVNEFYGSDRDHAFLAARPEFRLPDVKDADLERYVKKSLDVGINFNYTMNSIHPGDKHELEGRCQEIIDYVKWLEGIGVSRITVASPVLLAMIREASKDIKIEISTIAHIDTLTQIKYYRDTFGVDKVCGNLLKNRNIRFLTNAADWCNKNGVTYEVMVNEFCGVGGEDYTTHCTYRDSCYIQHAVNHTKEDALAMNNYPMEYCIWARKTDVSSWLKLRFVRPEDIPRYEAIGIHNYKITGRTGSTPYIVKMCEAYLSQHWDGNLLGLWKPLETIYTEQSELEFQHDIFIDNKKLNKFLLKWFKNPDFKCEEEVCGETCTYCHDFYDVRLDAQNKEYQKIHFVKKYDFSVED